MKLMQEAYVLESWRQCLRVLQSQNAHERRTHFNMAWWGTATPCGTVACIGGHCALDKWFQGHRGIHPHWYEINDRMEMNVDGDLVKAFGEDYDKIFYDQSIGSHAEAVRRVMRVISLLSGDPIVPLGWALCTSKLREGE